MSAITKAAGLAVVAALSLAAPAAAQGVEAVPVATLDQPTFAAAAPGRPHHLYVTQKTGAIRTLRNGVLRRRPFLDIRDLVASEGEQGLLGLAFQPRFRKTRRFYVYYTASAGCTPAGNCPIRVDEFRASKRAGSRAFRGSRRQVISIPHPDAANHNGGTIAFGRGGRLFLAPGDGGGGGDQFQNARSNGSRLGKLLRIKPWRRNRDRPGYRIPRSNPFVGRPGRDEIFSYGLRNPFRFSLDRGLNAVAIGDVGQQNREEVNIVTIGRAKGQGFGWPEFEGDFDYPESPPYEPPAPPIQPMHTYQNPAVGPASVTGGLVVRDPGLPQLAGRYLFADFYEGQIRSFVPNLETNTAVGLAPLDVAPIPNLVAFAAARDGQVYVLSLNGTLYRLEPEG